MTRYIDLGRALKTKNSAMEFSTISKRNSRKFCSLLLILFAISAMGFISCNTVEEEIPTDPIAVNLHTNNSVTRVANGQWQETSQIGFFMKHAGYSLSATSVYADANNVVKTVQSGKLISAPSVKYPLTGSVDFIAYFPFHSSVGNNFTIPVNVASQSAGLPTEVLFSNNITNQVPTENAVTLNFHYSLAKLELQVTGGANSTLTATDFANMTVSVEGMYTQADLQLANGTFANHSGKQTIALYSASNNATSATFQALVLPTSEEITFLFNVDGTVHRHTLTANYVATNLYKLNFALNFPAYPEVTATLLNAVIIPRDENTQNIVVDASPNMRVTIVNPYKNVNWTTFGRFKAALHVHSTNSDGSNSVSEMIERYYELGYDIVTMTDHNYITRSWDQAGYKSTQKPLTLARRMEIETGVGRGGRGMTGIDYTIEHSLGDHVNSFFVDFNNKSGQTLKDVVSTVAGMGGISRLNHPGRYTGAYQFVLNNDFEKAAATSRNPAQIQKYVDIFMAFPSCVGMEIINKCDGESAADRMLWDGILMQTIPQSRPVWGFADDDSHSVKATGFAWNVFLMPSLNQGNFRTVMETGAFYTVSRVSRLDNINATLPNGSTTPLAGNDLTLFMLSQSTPSIVNIEVNERRGTITISGADYDTIEWIADGVVIATGGTLRLLEHQEYINSYVRAQLKSSTGIAFTQPFGVSITSL